MCSHLKQFGQRPGSPVLEELGTAEREAVADYPRCNIWWFLVIAGSCIGIWLGALSLRHIDVQSQVDKSEATQAEQYKHILYRLDEIDKKLDKRVSSGKLDTLAVE